MNELAKIEISKLPDKELLLLAAEYGLNAKEWLRKFAALLPEIYKRRLYKKKGCVSIHEYAKKIAGMNEKTVDRILRLRQKLENKPRLLKLFESGEEGWSKLDRVAHIATPETDKNWANHARNLSKQTLNVYVQEYKRQFAPGRPLENDPETCQPSKNRRKLCFFISDEVEIGLKRFKDELERVRKEPHCWNDVIKELLPSESFYLPL
ncbi:MAG: hypothetical protein V1679_02645 [Candidatus Peregrinibacteria bacterium]